MHKPECTRYCAKQHCKCGRDALHGSKRCGVCVEIEDRERRIAAMRASRKARGR